MKKLVKIAKSQNFLTLCVAGITATFFVISGVQVVFSQVIFWEGPTDDPPTNNRPGYIWNSDGTAQDGRFNINVGITPAKITGEGLEVSGTITSDNIEVLAGTIEVLTSSEISSQTICFDDGAGVVDCKAEWPGGGQGGGLWKITGEFLQPKTKRFEESIKIQEADTFQVGGIPKQIPFKVVLAQNGIQVNGVANPGNTPDLDTQAPLLVLNNATSVFDSGLLTLNTSNGSKGIVIAVGGPTVTSLAEPGESIGIESNARHAGRFNGVLEFSTGIVTMGVPFLCAGGDCSTSSVAPEGDGTQSDIGGRGLGANDLQVLRSAADQVAAGDYSVIGGGSDNSIAKLASHSVVPGGQGVDIIGKNSFGFRGLSTAGRTVVLNDNTAVFDVDHFGIGTTNPVNTPGTKSVKFEVSTLVQGGGGLVGGYIGANRAGVTGYALTQAGATGVNSFAGGPFSSGVLGWVTDPTSWGIRAVSPGLGTFTRGDHIGIYATSEGGDIGNPFDGNPPGSGSRWTNLPQSAGYFAGKVFVTDQVGIGTTNPVNTPGVQPVKFEVVGTDADGTGTTGGYIGAKREGVTGYIISQQGATGVTGFAGGEFSTGVIGQANAANGWGGRFVSPTGGTFVRGDHIGIYATNQPGDVGNPFDGSPIGSRWTNLPQAAGYFEGRVIVTDRVSIGTTKSGHSLRVVDNANWSARFTSGTANVYLAHSAQFGLHIDTGGANSDGATRYALEVRNADRQHLYVRDDGHIFISDSSDSSNLPLGNEAMLTVKANNDFVAAAVFHDNQSGPVPLGSQPLGAFAKLASFGHGVVGQSPYPNGVGVIANGLDAGGIGLAAQGGKYAGRLVSEKIGTLSRGDGVGVYGTDVPGVWDARTDLQTRQAGQGLFQPGDVAGYFEGNVFIDSHRDGGSSSSADGGNLFVERAITVKGPITGFGDIFTFGSITALGNLTANGIISGNIKAFIQQDPNDPDRLIQYTALEGPEAVAYLRGSGQLVNGTATVELPYHFTAVTNPERITVQATLTSDAAGIFVASKSNTQLVFREVGGGSGNATFDYFVQGARLGFEDQPVYISAKEYNPTPLPVPPSAKAETPKGRSAQALAESLETAVFGQNPNPSQPAVQAIPDQVLTPTDEAEFEELVEDSNGRKRGQSLQKSGVKRVLLGVFGWLPKLFGWLPWID